MAITPLPPPPSRADSANFAVRSDGWNAAMVTFAAEITALQINTNAQTASDKTASAVSAAAAADSAKMAQAAWAASMLPAETLPTLNQSLHVGAVVKAIVYDTSKDSDGGAWRKRCQDKTWYTETLGGDRWIGQRASNAAAWVAAGNAVGAVYQSTADGLFYTPTSSSAQTQVYRGVSREFPAVAAIVAESGRVVIYDLTASGAMWMVFAGTGYLNTTSGGYVTSLAAVNSLLCFGEAGGGGHGLRAVSFSGDNFYATNSSARYTFTGGVLNRNSIPVLRSVGSGIIADTVNDIAITALPDAPIDPVTGLPTPTIAVATTGGLSTITNTLSVVNSTATTSVVNVDFDGKSLKAVRADGIVAFYDDVSAIGVAPSTTLSSATTPAFGGAPSRTAKRAGGSQYGVTIFMRNQAVVAKSMVAYVTNTFNSGWQPGDIRAAFLSDTVAETFSSLGELVTNGTFTTDTTGWTSAATYLSTAAVVTGEMRVTPTVNYGKQVQAVSLIVGRTYCISALGRVVSGTGTAAIGVSASNDSSGLQGSATTTSTTAVALVGTFVASAATMYVCAGEFGANNTSVHGFDNISVKLAEPDRSVKNASAALAGTLTKTAVGVAAALVAYSGFSAANYLEQPYSANLDFGTGDFFYMAWVNHTSVAVTQVYACRVVTQGTSDTAFFISSSGNPTMRVASTNIPAPAIQAGTLYHLAAVRTGGNLLWYINGVQVSSTASVDTMTRTAPLRIGTWNDGQYPLLGSMALLRIGATAPSADQIAQIYRTELQIFQPGAQCTIAGTSSSVTALDYDETTDMVHVGTSWGRSGFKDLLRVDAEATTTGALTSLSARQGVIVTGGTSAKVYVPAQLLRDELRRKDEARAALGKVPVFVDFTATASQTAFVLSKGYTTKALYKNGALMRETTTGVYWTRSNDGYQETCTLSVGASVSDWISVMATRNY